ncbi:hypothetical protein scyTo_0000352 [Scyliorhinus torazame]|uniref:Uncharacterized protein n=1 Tax=Scyliorhinus torazame TaxID=75743 RepID=A0A401NVT5_SCYTO|nr:hypothetical protein [Scyliorhinus torazame]
MKPAMHLVPIQWALGVLALGVRPAQGGSPASASQQFQILRKSKNVNKSQLIDNFWNILLPRKREDSSANLIRQSV